MGDFTPEQLWYTIDLLSKLSQCTLLIALAVSRIQHGPWYRHAALAVAIYYWGLVVLRSPWLPEKVYFVYLLASLFGPLTFAALYPLCRKAPRSLCACKLCGYDMRGNVSGICPECGAAIPDEQRRFLSEARSPPPNERGTDG